MQHAVAAAEKAGKYDSPSYQNAMNAFYGLYVFRHPVEADLDSTFATVNEAIYNYMQGPSEFTITGTFRDYNVRSFLPAIRVPVLFTVGEFDEVGPALIKEFSDSVRGSGYAVFGGAAHITPWDARDDNLKTVRAFLLKADSTASR
jgi:proline iminopeptidase